MNFARIALLAALTLPVAALAAGPSVYKARHDNFEGMGRAMKASIDQFKSGNPDIAVIRASAATLAASAPKVAGYFPKGTGIEGNPKSEALAEEVVHDINQGGSEHGLPAFRAFLQRMDRCYQEQVRDLVVMAGEDGTRGAAEFFIEGTYLATDDGLPPATGQTYRLRVGAFFEVKDGLVARVTNYYNLQDWLAQVAG